MTEPLVSCVMLTQIGQRGEMVERARRSFASQTYPCELIEFVDHRLGATIGASRNLANAHARGEIIAHFDDDDWSHPNRIAEQVALLQASGADVVGYNEALFWQTLNFCNKCGYSGSLKEHAFCNYDAYGIGGIAWLYRCPSPSYGLGSSLCYWRRVWEQKPFADINHGEDMRFITGLKVVGVSANYDVRTVAPVAGPMRWDAGDECEPRMICSIHGNNTSVYAPEKDRNMWRRAASFDDYCERTMKL